MYRVELKVPFYYNFYAGIDLFLMYRVELKEVPHLKTSECL